MHRNGRTIPQADAYTAGLVLIAQSTHQHILNRKHHRLDYEAQARQLGGLLSEPDSAEPGVARALRAVLLGNDAIDARSTAPAARAASTALRRPPTGWPSTSRPRT